MIAGCHNEPSQRENQHAAENTPVPKNILPRNIRITKENAYNDMFLDSAALEQFIRRQQLNDTLGDNLRSFYNVRNYQFAWFSRNGFTEQALAFRTLYDYTSDSATTRKSLDRRLDSLMTEDSLTVSAGDPFILKTEFLLSWRFINYINDKFDRPSGRELMIKEFVPLQKEQTLQLANNLLNAGGQDETNASYRTLKGELKKYAEIVKNGEWSPIPTGKKIYKKGMHSPVIGLIKKRLQATGQMTGKDTSELFTDTLANAVRAIQSTLGQKPTGIVGPELIKELNVPATDRVQQIIINLERMRWMPPIPEGRLITVNIPEFKLYVWDGKAKKFDMDVIVGRQGHSTVMFSGSLNQIVFSPYWNIPPSIVQKEILPHMEKDKKYLDENDMEVTGQEEGLPVIRQKPGDKNQLGKIKFLFPNSFNIYFHDTPQKELFKRDKRAFSHGCIRLSNPVKLANYLLEDMPEWTPQKIDSSMNSGHEKWVKIKTPVPVLIHYYTTWVDENGTLQFRQDIYKHDAKLKTRMFSDHSPSLAFR